MNATWARNNLSIVKPVGRNSGSITEAMNNTVISGTPRTSSMYPTENMRTAGNRERRPSASRIANGKANAMPMTARIKVSGKPNGYFYTDKSFKNYVIRYSWTYPKNQPDKTTMNSGLLVHIQEPHKVWPKSVDLAT